MTKKQINFINSIYPLAQYEKATRNKWVLPSVCIAQAILESGWNLKAKTIFGIKGGNTRLPTKEEINGKLVSTVANFKVYPNLASSVKGYYDLITSLSRYKNACNNNDYKATVKAICDGGYATDSNYYSKIITIIESYNLLQYDNISKMKQNETTYKIGDRVRVSSYYASSTSFIKDAVIKNAIGTITKIKPGTHNPYLLDNGNIGWCNNGDIREKLN